MDFSPEQLKAQQAYKGARTTNLDKLAMLVRIHHVDPQAFSPLSRYRAEVALSTKDRRTMSMLTLDEDTHVRMCLIFNERVMVDILDSLTSDPDEAVRAAAIKAINNIPR